MTTSVCLCRRLLFSITSCSYKFSICSQVGPNRASPATLCNPLSAAHAVPARTVPARCLRYGGGHRVSPPVRNVREQRRDSALIRKRLPACQRPTCFTGGIPKIFIFATAKRKRRIPISAPLVSIEDRSKDSDTRGNSQLACLLLQPLLHLAVIRPANTRRSFRAAPLIAK